MASSGVAKWGLPVPEHTLFTGTDTDAPVAADSGQVVVVVGAMVVGVGAPVVAVRCAAVVVGAVADVLVHAAARSPIVAIPAARRSRRRVMTGA